jgi:hypothetical protein
VAKFVEFLTTGSFPHDNFSFVYWIFTKLGHMIPLWKGKNPIYFGVITIIPFDNYRVLPLLQGKHVAKFAKDPIYRTTYRAETTLLSKIIFIVTVTLTFDLMIPK